MSRKKFNMMKKSFGARLKELRLKKELKQYQVAEGTGILKSTLSELENDKHSPSAEALVQLSEYFKVSCSWLLLDKTTAGVAETKLDYGLPALNIEERKLIEKGIDIITSNTIYSSALISNINAFYQAMAESANLKARISALEKKRAQKPKGGDTEKKVM